MKTISSFQDFAESLIAFIRSDTDSQTETSFNELALALFALQFSEVAAYRKFCEARRISPAIVKHWSEIPALPTSAFKEFEISSLPPEQRTHVFHSSGTTEQIPSRHFHNAESLAIYEASLLPWFKKHFLADWDEDAGSWISDFSSNDSRRRTLALTLTLSPEEREHRSTVSGFSDDSATDPLPCISVQRKNILPLPGGEGRGEGERSFSFDKPSFVFLTPSPVLATNSSLVHMFETIRRELGSEDSLFTGELDEQDDGNIVGQASSPPKGLPAPVPRIGGQDARTGRLEACPTIFARSDASASTQASWSLDLDKTLFALRKAMRANRPIALVGTAFSFVHLLDYFAANNRRYRLANGSRVLETGGYKGRSRSLPKAELHQLITEHLGIPASHIVCEYGMSELSSQAYDSLVQSSRFKVQSHRSFRFPPWARAQIISLETGKEVGEGETGLIRIFDLANVYSVLAIQTEDLAIRRGDGFELLGRAAITEPRGCSLMATNG